MQDDKEEKITEKDEKYNILTIVTGIGGLVITILGTGLYPIIIFPLLDYSVTPVPNGTDSYIELVLKNMGLTSAKNVIISMHSENATFGNSYTEPYLPEQIEIRTTPTDIYVKTSVLPPRSDLKLIAGTNPSESDAVVIPYVLSEETIGKTNQLAGIIFYISLAVIYGISFIKFYYSKNSKDEKKKGKRGIIALQLHHVAICLAVVIVYSTIYYAFYYALFMP